MYAYVCIYKIYNTLCILVWCRSDRNISVNMIQWNIYLCEFFGLLHNCSRTSSSHLFSLKRSRLSWLILWHNILISCWVKPPVYNTQNMSRYLQNSVNFPIMWPILPSKLARNLAQSWQVNARYCFPLTRKINTAALCFITACSFVDGYKSFVLLPWRRRRQMFHPEIW